MDSYLSSLDTMVQSRSMPLAQIILISKYTLLHFSSDFMNLVQKLNKLKHYSTVRLQIKSKSQCCIWTDLIVPSEFQNSDRYSEYLDNPMFKFELIQTRIPTVSLFILEDGSLYGILRLL